LKKHPKAFMSHASEDKKRFVLDFAKKLRQKGIDAWLDKWEMKLGDSLIDKIFEEGIKECDVFIIVLSKNSVNKKWVREELNIGLVQRIENNTKLIPVIIDKGIDIPTSLKNTVWVKISNLSAYEREFNEILMSIYGESERPSLGKQPKYISKNDIQITGLNRIDITVLKILGQVTYEKNNFVDNIMCCEIIQRSSKSEIPEEKTYESLELLELKGLVEIQKLLGPREMYFIKLTPFGFVKYCENFINNCNQRLRNILSSIINEDLRTDEEIVSKTGHKLVEVRGFFEYFNAIGYIKIIKTIGGPIQISHISAIGKKNFKDILNDCS